MKRKNNKKKNAGGGGTVFTVLLYSHQMFFFSISAAVLQRCHNRGWTSLSPLCLLSRQLTMEHSAGGDPDPLIVLWQPWPSQLENRKTKNPA